MSEDHDDRIPDTPEELLRKMTEQNTMADFLSYAKRDLDNGNSHAMMMITLIAPKQETTGMPETYMDIRLWNAKEPTTPLLAFYIGKALMEDALHNLDRVQPFPCLPGESVDDEEGE